MKYLFFSLILFFISGSDIAYNDYFLQVDCEIYDHKGDIVERKNVFLCHFFADGSWLGLKYLNHKFGLYNSNNSTIWEKNVSAHHELFITRDYKILILASETGQLDGVKTRFDTLKIYDLKGNEISSWSFRDHVEEFKKILSQHKKNFFVLTPPRTLFPGHQEFTHVNSFKEIPPNDLYPQLDYMKPGNYIVGVNCYNLFFIMNKALTRIEKVLNYSSNDQMCGTHDAQVLSSGKILHYMNHDSKDRPASRLELFDPSQNKAITIWPKDPQTKFYNSLRGSIQPLDNGGYLFTDKIEQIGGVAEIKEINAEGTIIRVWKMNLRNNDTVYRARKLKLGKYLKNIF